MTFRLPADDEHTSIVGRNGSGKSQLGAWLLSKRDLKAKPWVILDYKGEELFNQIPKIREIGFKQTPKEPGLYILHSRPDLVDQTERFLWGLWHRENIGLFVDEGYMVPQPRVGGAYRALLTQGRSKQIPVITLTQRPVQIDRFAFSEASHVVVFHLNDERDVDTIRAFTPKGFAEWVPDDLSVDGAPIDGDRLPPYHSRWYNIKDDAKYLLRPVPKSDQIVADIDAQLAAKNRFL